MDNRISRREFARMIARGGLLALLGYGIIRAFGKPDEGKTNAQCPYPGKDCSNCFASNGCRSKTQDFGKDS
ncbi:MAG TPA: hypothetical protein DET40_01680 [Lentisphaeria bacterium]|nr:MAG: hypothetical protein A2X45_17040 [Lentisphaerae bacterium GWF2_50_93]HCE42243.1 hypothetical protein [Lentisphaeria bacterium]